MVSDELLGLLKRQQVLEQETVDSLTPLVKSTKNSVIRLFLNQLVLDSMKHVDVLQAIMDLNAGAVVSDIDKHRMKRGLNEHVKGEEAMLRNIENIMDKVEDKKIRFLLMQMAADEKRHHKILEQLMKVVENIENIRDKDWWDLYYDRAEWLF